MTIAFYDIWILTTVQDEVSKLEAFEAKDSKICCYWDQDSVYRYLNGFIRYIGYDIYNEDEGISHAN